MCWVSGLRAFRVYDFVLGLIGLRVQDVSPFVQGSCSDVNPFLEVKLRESFLERLQNPEPHTAYTYRNSELRAYL